MSREWRGRGGIGPVEIRVIEDRAAKIGPIELRRPPRMA
jgi:hypothetical protein